MNNNTLPYENVFSDLLYSDYKQDKVGYIKPPKPSLNGGLYTGEEFKKNASYRNFPNEPDSVYLNTYALKSANPPPGVEFQFPDTFRPGNNLPNTQLIGLSVFDNKHSIVCTHTPLFKNCSCSKSSECECVACNNKKNNLGFNKHYYI